MTSEKKVALEKNSTIHMLDIYSWGKLNAPCSSKTWLLLKFSVGPTLHDALGIIALLQWWDLLP